MRFANCLPYVSFAIVLLFAPVSNAQTKKQLETQRKKLQKEITQVNKLLFSTQKQEKNALDDLKDLNQKISVRSKLIQSIKNEATFLTEVIAKNEKEISKLQTSLNLLKKEYATMIYRSYKSKSKQDLLLFVLSSFSFQQAYKRLQYVKQYTSYREKQGEEIVKKTTLFKKLNDSLLLRKTEKKKLVLSETSEKSKIESDKKNKEILISEIKKKEKKYISEIRLKQQEERKISAKIDKIIKDAIAKSNKNKTTKKGTGFSLSPAAKALASQFEKNKGKLPWPVREGLIVRRYGRQAHPTLRGITITSNGLHIATTKDATAKSVFKGKVLAVQLLSGGRKAVLVQHGNYITTYNNLETLFVKNGDPISTGQELGKIFTNKITNKTILVFVLHKETQRQNPASWILKK